MLEKKQFTEKEADNQEIWEPFSNAMHDHSLLSYKMASSVL